MSDLLSFREKESEEEKIADIIETFGMGFDEVYKDGKYEGRLEGKLEGRLEGKLEGKLEGIIEAKLEDASNLLSMGVDEDIILKCTGISIDELNKLKRDI